MPDLFPFIPYPDSVPGLAWVYILQSADDSLYIGHTRDLRERTRKHRLGLGSKHTHDHAVPNLIYCEDPMALEKAIKREAQLKRWSRAKKEALIRGDVANLRTLALSRERHG